MTTALLEFQTREAASGAAAAMAAEALAHDIGEQGFASLFVSGGSTPEKMFRDLSGTAIDWAHVTVGLVDERWVSPDDPESNERLVRAHLLKGAAGTADFIPLWVPETDFGHAAEDRSRAYAPHCAAASFVLLGMGLDGHTASWFPGMERLSDIVSKDYPGSVAAVLAPGARTSQRLTLTGPAVVNAKRAVLLVFGTEKRAKLEMARKADPLHYPVRYAIDGLGDRLSIVWAP